MRFTTDFFEYLRYSVAKEIDYNHHTSDGNGEFVIKSKRTKIIGASIKKQDKTDRIPVSTDMRKSFSIKKDDVSDFKRSFK